jgi:uncharacterized protein with HEPN domain
MQRDLLLVGETIGAVDRIQQLVGDLDVDQLSRHQDRRDALLWNYTVLGEAAGQVSDDTKAQHPRVPWGQPAKLRNRIVHGYWSIDLEILVATARHQLPALSTDLHGVLAALSDEPDGPDR